MLSTLAFLAAAIGPAIAGTVIWDGRFNDMTSSADLNKWSWSNQVGPYQYYIHGSGSVEKYVNLSPSYKNPSDTSSAQGAKLTIDSTSYWNGQNMRRTELIPQTSAPIASGKVYYHFSLKRSSTNAPLAALEHQINFFESHFTELKYGLLSGASGSSDPTLKWCVGGSPRWSTALAADEWHNAAYEIDFGAGTVGFWHSVGSADLARVVAPVAAGTSSNGADWHLGVLRLPGGSSAGDPAVEDWFFSGVYVESGSLTTKVAGPGGVAGGGGGDGGSSSSSSSVGTTATATLPGTTLTTSSTSSAPVSTTSAPAAGTIAKYQQCGGANWAGSGSCVAGTTCTKVNDYYHQCL